MHNVPEQTTLLIDDYVKAVAPTDGMNSDIKPVLFGMFGEVGGIMAASKKLHREGKAFSGYRRAVEEEFGDTLWYLAALCRRIDIPLVGLFEEAISRKDYKSVLAASDIETGAIAKIMVPENITDLDDALLGLGEVTSSLLKIASDKNQAERLLIDFVDCYLKALQVSGVPFGDVARFNLTKTIGAFVEPELEKISTFDSSFKPEEQLPSHFEIEFTTRESGQCYLRWNDVFIGDPLTDNISDADDYRFHDVFHLSYAAILHWSPVIRALIKQKRKSDKVTDEEQDGGRAIVVEEGLTAWIFTRAKEMNFFEGEDSISLDTLKTIGDFVQGYEVSQCPLSLWKRTILDGYKVFRQVRENKGGIVIGDRNKRTIEYQPLKKEPM